jgi:DNA-directed RNA polymerase subunit RPC12/RpoP
MLFLKKIICKTTGHSRHNLVWNFITQKYICERCGKAIEQHKMYETKNKCLITIYKGKNPRKK